ESNSAKHECKVACLAGVVETVRAIWLASARTPYQQVGAPSAALHLGKQRLCVMGVDGAFESVQEQHVRSAVGRVRRRIEPVDFQEIIVRRFPAFYPGRDGLLSTNEFSPEGLSVRAGYPPGWRVMNGAIAHRLYIGFCSRYM